MRLAILDEAKAPALEALKRAAQLSVGLGPKMENKAEALLAIRAGQEAALRGEALEVIDGVARISVSGMLLAQPSAFLELIGVEHSDYETIRAELAAANASDDVEAIELQVNSPGGLVEGMFAAAEAIAASLKPTTARVSNVAASAAYFLASQAGRVVATSESDRLGSVGIAVDLTVDPDTVSVASSNAPNKRPDVSTEEGRAIVRAQLDQVEGLMFGAIAEGRGLPVATVETNFGRGGVMLAGPAKAAGMIDAIEKGQDQQVPNENQVSGVRAALGLPKDTDREELVRQAIAIRAQADEAAGLASQLERLTAMHDAAKDQLAKARGTIEALQASEAEREQASFEARRDATIEAALKENKITPAQVGRYTALAKDEDGLTQVAELFAITAPMGLTKPDPDAQTPKGQTKVDPDNEEHVKAYAKAYGLLPDEARRILKKQTQEA